MSLSMQLRKHGHAWSTRMLRFGGGVRGTCATDAHSGCLCPTADWTVRDSQAPNYFKTTLESISRDDSLNLVSSHIHLTGVAPDQANDLRFIIARVRLRRFGK